MPNSKFTGQSEQVIDASSEIEDQPLPIAEFPVSRTKKNFSWLLFSNVTYAACQWGMIIALAKEGTPNDIGGFSLAMAVTSPVVLFAAAGLRNVLATDHNRTLPFKTAFWARVYSMVISFAVISIVAVAVPVLRPWLGVTIAVAVARVFDSLSDIIYGLLMQRERMNRISISRSSQGILQLVSFAIAFALTKNLVWACIVYALSSALLTVTYDWRSMWGCLREDQYVGNFYRDQPVQSEYLKLFRSSYALAFVAVLPQLTVAYLRISVERVLGPYTLGIFSAMAYLTTIGNLPLQAALGAVSPRLAALYNTNPKGYRGLVAKLAMITAVGGGAFLLVGSFFGRPLLTFFYGGEYAQASSSFVWILAGLAAFQVFSVLYQGSFVSHKFARLSVPFIGYFLATVALAVPFSRIFGITGAAVVTFISTLIGLFLQVALFYRQLFLPQDSERC